MSDLIDRAQEREQLDRELALEQQQHKRIGLSECEECGAAISAERQALGARLCMPHQHEVEADQRKRSARTCV